MADEKNTIHTIFTGEANLSVAEKELAGFASAFEAVMKRMAGATSKVDQDVLKTVASFNKMVGAFDKANKIADNMTRPNGGRTRSAGLDGSGARDRRDIRNETSSVEADLFAYRKTVTKAMAGTVLAIDEQIRKETEVYKKLGRSRRKNVEELNQTNREIERLNTVRSKIMANPYVAQELAGARTAAAKAKLRTAAADDKMATRAAEELAGAKMRLMAIEVQLNGVSNRGSKSARVQALREEQANLQQLVSTYQNVASVVEKFNQNYTRNLGKSLNTNDKQTAASARQHLEIEERVATIKARVNQYEQGSLAMDRADLANLVTELRYSEQLLALHRQDAEIMSRVATLRERANAKRQRDEMSAARLEAETMNREIDKVAATSAARDRMARKREADAYRVMRAEADAMNKEFDAVNRTAKIRNENSRKREVDAAKALRAEAEADNKEFDRVKRRAAARQAEADAAYRAMRAEADAANRNFDLKRTRNDPGVAARQYLGIEKQIAQVEAEKLRLQTAQGSLASRDITLLDMELARLRAEAQTLTQIAGIEQRITGERAKQAKPTKSEGQSRLQNIRQNPGDLMGIQAELMGNYAAFGVIQGAVRNLATSVVTSETALTKFQAIASASGDETARLAKDMESLGANSKYTNLEIIETATVLAQAGLSARDTGPALKAIGELATAAGTELKQAADVVTSVSNIWGYTTSEMGNVANILTSALNKTKLGMDQMQLGIQYAGNAAADAGIDFVELTALMGAAAQAGIRSGSTIGTGIRALTTDLLNPTEKTVAAVQRLGLSMQEVDVRTLGLTQVLHNLKNAGFGSADAFGAFEIRAAAMFSAISNNLPIVDDLQASLYGTNAASEASSLQMTTLQARWTSFMNSAQNVAKDGLAPVIELLKLALMAGTGFLEMLNKAPPVTAAVTGALTTMFAALAVGRLVLATQAILGMVGVIGAVGPAAGVATTGLRLFTVAFMGVPIIGWIAGIAALAAAVFSLGGMFTKTGERADKIKGEINDLTSRMQENQQITKTLEGAMARLNTQYGVLSDNAPMRERILEQTRQRFEKLGLEVDKGSDSVDGMIQALNKLRNALQEDFSSELFSLAAKMRLEIEEMNKDLDKNGGITPQARDDFLSAYDESKRAYRGAGFSQTTTPLQDDMISAVRGINDLSHRDTTSLIRRGADRSRTLQTTIDRAPAGAALIPVWRAELKSVTQGMSVLGDHLSALNRVTQRSADAEDTASQGLLQEYLSNPVTRGYQVQNGVALNARTRFSGRVQDILSSNASDTEKAAQGAKIAEEARSLIQQYNRQIDDFTQTNPDLMIPPGMADKLKEILEALVKQTVEDIAVKPFQGTNERAADEAKKSTTGRDETNTRNANQSFNEELATARDEELRSMAAAAQQRALSATSMAEWEKANADYMALQPQIQARARAAAEAELQNSSFYDIEGTHLRPASGPTISRMGSRQIAGRTRRQHEGIDIDGNSGDKVQSVAGGTIEMVGSDPKGWGNYLRVKNDDGTTSLYAHLKQIDVTQGSRVDRGQQIGLMGGGAGDAGRGNATGSHLHYELRNKDGVLINPEGYSGQQGTSSGNTARFNELRATRGRQIDAQLEADAETARRARDRRKREIDFIPDQRNMKARRDTNNLSIKAMIEGLVTAGDETTSLANVVTEIRAKVQDNLQIARDLLAKDPKNEDRLGTPELEGEISQEQIQVMLAGADRLDDAYAAYAKLQERISQTGLDFIANEQRVADANVGTSGTTKFLLDQRAALETYTAAQRDLVATQVIYAQTMARVADATNQVAEANAALAAATATGDEKAITAARERATAAAVLLDRLRTSQAAAGVNMGAAQRNVTATKPVGPISNQAAGATAGGIDPLTNPMGLLEATIDRYKQQSGVMTGLAQTVADGIYGAFTSLGDGIEQTINQIADGSITIQGAFKNIFGGVLKEMQGMAAKIAANWIMQYILKMVVSRFGAPAVGGGSMDAQGMSMLNSGGMPGLALGGTPRRRALGGGGVAGRDSIHTLVEPGEITMRKSAVDFVGRDTLLGLNSMGNRRLSAAAGKIPEQTQREPDKVNVWVVPADQVPQPSAKDIIHKVGESIMHGELKKLVKTVSVGG